MDQPISPKKSNYNTYHIYKGGKVILHGIPESLINKEEIAVQLNLSFNDKQSSPACLSIIKQGGYTVEHEFKEDEYKEALAQYRTALTQYNQYIMKYSIEDEGYKVTPLTEYLYDVAKREDDSEFIGNYVDVLVEVEKITGIQFLKGFI